MGVSVSASERMIPVLHCNGNCDATNRKFTFDGVQSCTAAKRFYGGTGVCAYGCLGLGDCVSVCENDVISIKNGIATFCTEKCVSCNKCAKVCPNGLIELRPEKKKGGRALFLPEHGKDGDAVLQEFLHRLQKVRKGLQV